MRKNKITNYFIILQLCKFNREKCKSFFIRNIQYLHKEFKDCIFDFTKEDQKIFKNFTSEVKMNAINTYNDLHMNILYYEDEIFPQNIKCTMEHPICLFYKGNINLLNKFSLSIVGTRNPSDKAINDTNRISDFLCSKNIIIVSGLAKGIDVTSHKVCKSKNYSNAIAVVGTPLGSYYPKENKDIQQQIENNGLLITEIPPFEVVKKWNFLRRNYIMSSISNATIVMQAGDTSGTVSQARSTLKNGKKLFVPASVFDDKDNSWPTKFRNEYDNVFRFEFFQELTKLVEKEMEDSNESNN